MTILTKYDEATFSLPSVIDFINFESHAAIDIIQMKGETFKKGEELRYNEHKLSIVKKIKDYPVQTESNLQNRLEYRRVRYYCNKIL